MFLHHAMSEREADDYCSLCTENGLDRIELPGELFVRLLLLAMNHGWQIEASTDNPLRARQFKTRGIQFRKQTASFAFN